MMKKICPICDMPVDKHNYCSRCRRIIRNPVMWNSDYYLNERPPALPKDTENYQPFPEPSHQIPHQPGTLPSLGEIVRSSGRPHSGKKGVPSAAGIVAVVMVLVLNVVVPAFRGVFKNYSIPSISETTASYDDSGYIEYDEADVIGAGKRCSGNSHFPVDGREIADSVRQYVTDSPHGYLMDEEDTYSDNYGFENENGLTTYYETTKGIYLKKTAGEKASEEAASGDDSPYQYVDFNYDTATGELHYYASSLKNDQATLDYLEKFLTVTESVVEISEEESSVSAIMDQAGAGILRQDGAYILEGLFDISIYRNEDEVTVFVYYNDPQLTEDQEV